MREKLLMSKACDQKHTVYVKDGQSKSFKLVLQERWRFLKKQVSKLRMD